ncbi:Acidic Amino Acid Decarboxylase Gadl1 [Manis pentadactyla]|nr:Acidic Amino Acid Decarboxylase Gadl1 [Manis pentadactyla]
MESLVDCLPFFIPSWDRWMTTILKTAERFQTCQSPNAAHSSTWQIPPSVDITGEFCTNVTAACIPPKDSSNVDR